jgi:DNA invertase Pin-like site-specific DNA recombinase
MKIGYARVSTLDQSTEIQIAALKEAGCEEIYSENMSGKNRNRPELKALLKSLRKNDTLVTTKIDRLARSLSDLFKISDEIEKKEANLQILEQNFDTGTATGKLIFSVLGALAEFERHLIVNRTTAGLERAKANGKKLGRKRKVKKEDERKMKKLWEAGESWNELAKTFGVSRQSIYNRVREWKAEAEPVLAIS